MLTLRLTSKHVKLAYVGLSNYSFLKFLCQRNSTLRHCVAVHRFSTQTILYAKRKTESKSADTEIVKSREPTYGQLTLGGKVKQAGKDATYGGVIVAGIGITLLLGYCIFHELFSGKSPSGVYSKAVKDCKKNYEVVDTLGSPIKSYGELSSRGRRRHVSHTLFEVDGVKHMRMKFYLEGSVHKATVHLEVKQNEAGKFEYRYMFVEVTDAPYRKAIVIENNR